MGCVLVTPKIQRRVAASWKVSWSLLARRERFGHRRQREKPLGMGPWPMAWIQNGQQTVCNL